MFPFLSCSPVMHTELLTPVVLFQQGAVLWAPREIQAVFKSLSISPSTSQGQDFNSQLPNQICMAGIRYVLAVGTLSLPSGRGRRCSREWPAQRPLLDGFASSGATPAPRSAEMPVLAEKRFVPVPEESVVCQKPAPGLSIPQVLCTNSYLTQPGGNMKDTPTAATRRKVCEGNLPMSGEGLKIQMQELTCWV